MAQEPRASGAPGPCRTRLSRDSGGERASPSLSLLGRGRGRPGQRGSRSPPAQQQQQQQQQGRSCIPRRSLSPSPSPAWPPGVDFCPLVVPVPDSSEKRTPQQVALHPPVTPAMSTRPTSASLAGPRHSRCAPWGRVDGLCSASTPSREPSGFCAETIWGQFDEHALISLSCPG
ncbi:SH3 domain-containing protein 21-like [Heterocephalus glaber]|uniref:SH3 domain-containing protein 21-like n=1 Tax=Heterocephalus glaber TaxID=10181 RepID=A0AAX6SWG4_HETGA|nr:SH3 domain-containing protein 21-like [Heterocephalus glaber]